MMGGFLASHNIISKPEAQAPTPVIPMPIADSEETAAAKKRSIAAQLGRRGRTSTILTADGDTLG